MPKYAVSDIHGCPKTFLALLDKIQLSPSDELFLLGDYVDRGPDSKGVIDLVFKLQHEGYRVTPLRGNHEQLVLNALVSTEGLESWVATDGKRTLDSFGVTQFVDIPWVYLDFLDKLPHVVEVDEYILVHAGINFHLPHPYDDAWSLLTIRHWHEDINPDWLKGRIVIHGHTPMMREAIELLCSEISERHYLDIDAGCVYAPPQYTNRFGMGFLCAFDLGKREVVFQRNVE